MDARMDKKELAQCSEKTCAEQGPLGRASKKKQAAPDQVGVDQGTSRASGE